MQMRELKCHVGAVREFKPLQRLDPNDVNSCKTHQQIQESLLVCLFTCVCVSIYMYKSTQKLVFFLFSSSSSLYTFIHYK